MTQARPSQVSFTGGEVAPSLRSRVDLSKYGVSCQVLENFFVHAHGGVSNRAGLKFVREVKDSTKKVRLIGFQFNTEQSYILEMGDGYMRVHKDGGTVLSGAVPYEMVTPYGEDDLSLLKFAQTADTMTICHPDYDVRELTRTDHDAWTLTVVSFEPDIDAPTGLSTSSNHANTDYTWRYKVTALHSDTLEESEASAAVSYLGDTDADWDATDYIDISWSAVTGAGKYNIYKEKNGIYGYIGSAETTTFRDDKIAPEMDDTPPELRTPFNGSGNKPSTLNFFEQRKVFSNSTNKPQSFWFTQTALYNNLNVSSPTKADDAISFTIAARQVNEVRHIVSLNELIALTSGGEWKISSTEGSLTPKTVSAKQQGEHGSSHVPPITVGSTVLFNQSGGRIIRDLGYSFESDSYEGRDLTILANHIFENSELKEWTFAKEPYGIVWGIKEDGTWAAMTYLKEHEVTGWHQHSTAGKMKSIASVREGNSDAVYAVVEREINGSTVQYIERMADRNVSDARMGVFLDSSLSYNDPLTIESITTATPAVVTITGHGYSDGDLVDIGDVRYKVAGATTNTFELNDQDDDSDIDGNTVTGDVSRKAVLTVSGLDHLEGEDVTILADGSVIEDKTVSSGSVTLDQRASIIHVGLGYQSNLQPLDVEFEQTHGRKKQISKVVVKLYKSGEIEAGRDENSLKQQKVDVSHYDDPKALYTKDVELNILPTWKTGAAVYIRNSSPKPCTILSMTPLVNVGQ